MESGDTVSLYILYSSLSKKNSYQFNGEYLGPLYGI